VTGDPGRSWDDVARLLVAGRSQRLWRRHSDAVNRRLIEAWLPGRARGALKTDLFDEAVGEGLYPVLAERFGALSGIDSSAPIVRAAAARYPELRAMCADVRRLPFPDAAFQVVVSNSTLDHFDRPREIVVALRELARVLEPGGKLLVTLDNPGNPILALTKALPRAWLNRLWFSHASRASAVGLAPYYVGATLDRQTLNEVLRSAGFAVEAEATVVHAPRPLAVVLASRLERRSRPRAEERFSQVLMRCEHLARYPSRGFTGYFNAVLARRT
jgi:SAM-dependent methyltransferase